LPLSWLVLGSTKLESVREMTESEQICFMEGQNVARTLPLPLLTIGWVELESVREMTESERKHFVGGGQCFACVFLVIVGTGCWQGEVGQT
jgi:hypothetical protein